YSGGGGRPPSGPGGDRGFNNTVVQRTLYKFSDANALDKDKRVAAVMVKLGISDGFSTEVLEGLADEDIILTGVIMPGAVAAMAPPPGGAQNPFSSGRSSFGGSSGGSRGR
ncbi:MAG: hypothetical protein RL077_5506, partial [Verrucomicrobiota bacterium]